MSDLHARIEQFAAKVEAETDPTREHIKSLEARIFQQRIQIKLLSESKRDAWEGLQYVRRQADLLASDLRQLKAENEAYLDACAEARLALKGARKELRDAAALLGIAEGDSLTEAIRKLQEQRHHG